MYFAGSDALDGAAEACSILLPPPFRGTSTGGVLAVLCGQRASRRCAETVTAAWKKADAKFLNPDYDALRLSILRATIGALTGNPDALLGDLSADIELLALDVLSYSVVRLSPRTTPTAPAALALLACTAHPTTNAPVSLQKWLLVDVEFSVPPRVLELSMRPRSFLALWAPRSHREWPLHHPAADRLEGLLRFPAALLERACICNTAFARRWPDATSLAASWLLLLALGVFCGIEP